MLFYATSWRQFLLSDLTINYFIDMHSYGIMTLYWVMLIKFFSFTGTGLLFQSNQSQPTRWICFPEQGHYKSNIYNNNDNDKDDEDDVNHIIIRVTFHVLVYNPKMRKPTNKAKMWKISWYVKVIFWNTDKKRYYFTILMMMNKN